MECCGPALAALTSNETLPKPQPWIFAKMTAPPSQSTLGNKELVLKPPQLVLSGLASNASRTVHATRDTRDALPEEKSEVFELALGSMTSSPAPAISPSQYATYPVSGAAPGFGSPDKAVDVNLEGGGHAGFTLESLGSGIGSMNQGLTGEILPILTL